MKTIVRMKFGSHLYGTATPESDLDFKSVFVPDARSILLQRVKDSRNNHRPKEKGEKNAAGEVDEEAFSLQRFLALLAEGQTIALDMLFAPDYAIEGRPDPLWQEIYDNRHRLVTRKAGAFVGYVRAQANKYGIKGSRVAAARATLDLLVAGYSSTDKLGGMDTDIRDLISKHPEHMGLVEDRTPHGQIVLLWEVCNRKMPYTASIKNAHDIMKRLVDEYGKRALMAEKQQGVDWKALSHAVRVGQEALELLRTGHITFPLPDAAHVLEIKRGLLPYRDVAAEIEGLLDAVEAAAAASVLPEEPDLEWIDDFVMKAHRSMVFAAI